MVSRTVIEITAPSLAGDLQHLSVFFDEAGRVAFRQAWPNGPASLLKKVGLSYVQAGTPLASACRIRDDIIASCSAGLVETFFVTNIKRRRSAPLEPRHFVGRDFSKMSVEQMMDENFDPATLPDDPDERDPDFEDARPERFAILPSFWKEPSLISTIDWEASRVTIPAAYVKWCQPILYGRHDKNKGVSFENREQFDCLIQVDKPSKALSKLFRSIAVPNEAWFDRYRKHRNSMMLELTAVGWRYLAVTQPSKQHGLIKEIEQRLREYLNDEIKLPFSTDEPSDVSLNNLASNLYHQWCDGDLKASVITNSARTPKPNRPSAKK